MPRKSATDAVPSQRIDPKDFPTTEDMICLPGYGGLRTPTQVQRAIARAMDGIDLDELWDEKLVRQAFGGKKPPPVQPRTMVVLAGTRGGKSILASRRIVRSAFTCDISGLVDGDQVKVPCVATALDTADYVFTHALAACRSVRLQASIVGKPLNASFRIARMGPVSEVELTTVALSGKGSNLVGCWLGGAAFDEAPRMASEQESVRSLKASRRSVADRILPGGQELLIGSPYGPSGDVYELWKERFGHPDEDVCVVQASGPMLNPTHWTPELLEMLKRKDPFVYITSGCGEFADPPDSLIPSKCLEKQLGKTASKNRKDGVEYIAALGAAERGAGWSLVVLGTTENRGGQRVMEEAVSKQWFNIAGNPLQSRKTLKEVADIVKDFGLDAVWMNQRFVDSYFDAAEAVGLGLIGVPVEANERIELMDKLRDAIVEGRLQLTSNRQQYSDLIHVQKKPTVNGITVQYPSSGEGVACDFVEPLGLCVKYAPDAPIRISPAKARREESERATFSRRTARSLMH
jgi:hypothetical protein